MSAIAPLLIFSWGNPSRGDDAIGPLIAERVAEHLAAEIAAGEVEVLTDFQLQVEHALDLAGRKQVFFVDASISCADPYSFSAIDPALDPSISTHSVSPFALLKIAERVIDPPLPRASLLAVRGSEFELGAPLGANAARNLDAALDFLVAKARQSIQACRSGLECAEN